LIHCQQEGIDYALKHDESIIKDFGRTRFRGWVGWPIVAYKRFHHYYPDALWIITTRQVDDWIVSYASHVRKMRKKARRYEYAPIALMSMAERYAMFGTPWPDEDILREAYAKITGEVMDFFLQRKADVLEYPLCDGAGWAPLCEFLTVDEPDEPFPFRNPSATTAWRMRQKVTERKPARTKASRRARFMQRYHRNKVEGPPNA
jgi:hypothetical protein